MKTLKNWKSFKESYTDRLRKTVLKLENSKNGHCSGSTGGGTGHCTGFKEEDIKEEEEK